MKRRNPASAELPSKGAIKLLQKLAKGGKGDIPIAELKEVAPLLGWRVTATVWPSPIHGPAIHAITRALGSLTRFVSGGGGSKGRGLSVHSNVWDQPYAPSLVVGTQAQRDVAAEAIIARLRELYGELPRGQKPPADISEGAIYISGLSVDRNRSDEGVAISEEVWVGARAYAIEAPGVQTFILWREFHGKGPLAGEEIDAIESSGFWTWAYKHANAKDVASSVLTSIDADEIAERTRAASAPSLEHTGICQICGDIQKLAINDAGQPVLVDHGYRHEKTLNKRVGYGYGELGQRVGRCFGVGGIPWERGHDRLERYLALTAETLVGIALWQHNLRAGTVDVIKVATTDRRTGQPVEKTYTPRSPEWDDVLRQEISATDADVKEYTTMVALIKRRLESWTPRPLYDEIQAAKGRAVSSVPKRRAKR